MFFAITSLLVCAAPAPQEPAPPAEQRATGLPKRVKWVFNLDAGWGTFGFANSLYVNPKVPGVNERLSDQWFEGYVKPALSGSFSTAGAGDVYGKIGAAGERTYGSVPSAFGSDVSSFGPEDLYIGWRSVHVDVSAGREQYQLGHGLLVWDGAAEGGSRGGYWTNARKAFQFAAVARVHSPHHKGEVFYLDKDDLPEHETGTRLWGMNYEWVAGADDSTTLGATYMRFSADGDVLPGRDGLNVFNLRAYTAPFPAVSDLSFEFEYAAERNGDVVDANAWTLGGAYEFADRTWKPRLSYRYADFQDGFDPLLPGFHDWGTWWQGEIAGEYFLANSNLRSQAMRVHLTPTNALGTGVIVFDFRLDRPQAFGPQVTSSDVATEVDTYADWKVNGNFTLTLVGAFANPGDAVQQYTGRTKNFAYGMAYVAYSF